MSTRVGLISDVHAAFTPLREAIDVFAREGVDLLLCAGDVAGYGTELAQCVELIAESGCVTILGNHEIWYLERHSAGFDRKVARYFRCLPLTWEATLEGKRIMAVHASPPGSVVKGITLLDQDEQILAGEKKIWSGELDRYALDVLVVGHTHQVFAEMAGRTLVINPGSTVFNHTCAILSLPDQEVSIVPLSGKKPRKIWHWGMMTGEGAAFC